MYYICELNHDPGSFPLVYEVILRTSLCTVVLLNSYNFSFVIKDLKKCPSLQNLLNVQLSNAKSYVTTEQLEL